MEAAEKMSHTVTRRTLKGRAMETMTMTKKLRVKRAKKMKKY